MQQNCDDDGVPSVQGVMRVEFPLESKVCLNHYLLIGCLSYSIGNASAFFQVSINQSTKYDHKFQIGLKAGCVWSFELGQPHGCSRNYRTFLINYRDPSINNQIYFF